MYPLSENMKLKKKINDKLIKYTIHDPLKCILAIFKYEIITFCIRLIYSFTIMNCALYVNIVY